MLTHRCHRWVIFIVFLNMALVPTIARAATTLFSLNMQLLAPVIISGVSSLSLAGSTTRQGGGSVTTDTQLTGVFSAAGTADMAVVGSIVEPYVVLTRAGAGVDSGGVVRIDSFALSGDMNKTGLANFPATGALDNLQVGAAIHASNPNVNGLYQGSATFRLVHW